MSRKISGEWPLDTHKLAQEHLNSRLWAFLVFWQQGLQLQW